MSVRERLKTVLSWVGCIYGFIASLGLLAWHLCEFRIPLFCRLDFDSVSPNVTTYLLIVHGFMMFLVFLQRPEKEFRWHPLIAASDNAITVSKNLLGIAVWYFAFLLLSGVLAPSESQHVPGRNPTLVMTAFFLLQTLYIGLFFLIGNESLFSPRFRELFDIPGNLFSLIRRRRRRGKNSDGGRDGL